MPEKDPALEYLAQLDSMSKSFDQTMLVDRAILRSRFNNIYKNIRSKQFDQTLFVKTANLYQRSTQIFQKRLQNKPSPTLNESLPIYQQRDDIIKAILGHPVVVIAGETGSGKTTQLPQICMLMGRGVAGQICHTQPRRIAARSVAMRIAQELNSELGVVVGYKTRFSGNASKSTYIKMVTDGILLAELQTDKFLNQYDTIIIDEAHERNLNIDFLLGYLKLLLPKRPELKLIITSATIDTEKFSKHFDNAPIIEVSGRTYPVEVRYRPLDDIESDKDNQLCVATLNAINELDKSAGRGDVLVFLSGERDIRELHDFLSKHVRNTNTEILPLYSRLNQKDQNKIFQLSNKRHIVLSTNVAETSLTVPGIRFVIDTGLARINRYNYRNKVQRLPIEKISQSNANQRKGRCGRVSEGVCIRLYSEQDFQDRPPYMDPEIKRVNLAAVILRMKALRLGNITDFPFIDLPDERYVRDGYKLLNELSALDHQHRLTTIGKQLAKMPIDPKLGRMLIEADQRQALSEVLVMCSALSIQDPRERPRDKLSVADEQHSTFCDEQSDFIFYLKLWDTFKLMSQNMSNNKLRQWCVAHYLSFQRMKEWLDIHQQLSEIASDLGLKFNEQPADYTRIHCSILSGLLANVALKNETTEYIAARNTTIYIHPGSCTYNKPPKWLVAAELIETGKIYAATIAKIDPQWLETIAGHLTKHHYSEPHWDSSSGRVMAFDKITLFGLPVTVSKKVNYESIAPHICREIFIKSALVTMEFQSKANFYKHNLKVIDEIKAEEDRQRKKGILISEEKLYTLFDEVVPQDVLNSHLFESWVLKQQKSDPQILCFNRSHLTDPEAMQDLNRDRPDHLSLNGIQYKLEYTFDMDVKHDGITVIIPHMLVNQVPDYVFEWLVPGFLLEKVIAIIRALPKKWRRNFVPAPEYAKACVDVMIPYKEPLLNALTATLKKMTGIEVPKDVWQDIEIPPFLQMNYKIIDNEGRKLAQGKDFEQLKTEIKQQPRQLAVGQLIEKEGCLRWEFNDIPVKKQIFAQGYPLSVYPAIVNKGDSVALQLFENPDEANTQHIRGLIQLYKLTELKKVRYVEKNLFNINNTCLFLQNIDNCNTIKVQLMNHIIGEALNLTDNEIRRESEFMECVSFANAHIMDIANDLAALLYNIAERYRDLSVKLSSAAPMSWMSAVPDIKSQINALIYPEFLQKTSLLQLKHFCRYLDGIFIRLDKLTLAPQKDLLRLQQVEPFWTRYQSLNNSSKNTLKNEKELDQYHWLIEEFRISLFAQELGTAIPISEPRLVEYTRQHFNY